MGAFKAFFALRLITPYSPILDYWQNLALVLDFPYRRIKRREVTRMSNTTAYTYLKFERKRYRLWDAADCLNKDHATTCPKCGEIHPVFKRIVAQATTLKTTEVSTFARCSNCAHHFVWTITTKKSLKVVTESLESVI